MLSYLQFWEEWFGPFRLFQFISVRSVGAWYHRFIHWLPCRPQNNRSIKGYWGEAGVPGKRRSRRTGRFTRIQSKDTDDGRYFNLPLSDYQCITLGRTECLCACGNSCLHSPDCGGFCGRLFKSLQKQQQRITRKIKTFRAVVNDNVCAWITSWTMEYLLEWYCKWSAGKVQTR